MAALQILAQLDECKNIPDFNNYLAFILSQGDTLPVEVALRFYCRRPVLDCIATIISLSVPLTSSFLLGAAKRRLAVEEQFEAAVQGSARRVQTLCQGVYPSRPTLAHHNAPACIIRSTHARVACHL